jgi:regulator of protease activity HflC (stomatin/prohibitin superfamily)
MIYRKTNWGINICHQADVHVVERFGKMLNTETPGLYFAIPLVDTIRVVRTSEVCLSVLPLRATTQDNVMVETSGSAYVQVLDPVKALYGHVDPYSAVEAHVQVMRWHLSELLGGGDATCGAAGLGAAGRAGPAVCLGHASIAIKLNHLPPLCFREPQSAMRVAIGKLTLDQCFHQRAAINDIVTGSVKTAAEKWGMAVLR